MESSCSKIVADYSQYTYSVEISILQRGSMQPQNKTIISGITTAVTEPGVVKHVHCLPCCLIILLRVFLVIVFSFLESLAFELHTFCCNKIRVFHLGK